METSASIELTHFRRFHQTDTLPPLPSNIPTKKVLLDAK
jgi:hypothetical protein